MQIKFLKLNVLSQGAALCGVIVMLATGASNARAGLFDVPAGPADWNGPYVGFDTGVVWDHYDIGTYRGAVNLGGQFDQIVIKMPSPGDGAQQIDPPIAPIGFISFFAPGHSDTDMAPIGGLHVGYNKQFGHIVAGFEFGFDGTQTSKGSEFRDFQTNFLFDNLFRSETRFDSSRRAERNWDGYVGGQLGYAWGRFLFYASGGYTFADVAVYSFDRARTAFFENLFTDGLPINGFIGQVSSREYSVTSDIQNGWFAGGGTQYALNNKVSIGLEYRHSDFGDETYRFKPMHPIFSGATNVNLSSDQVEFKVDVMLGHLGH